MNMHSRILATVATTGLLIGAAHGATTSSDSGLQSSTESLLQPGPGQVSQPVSLGGIATDELPVIAKGVTEFGLSGYLDWTDDTTYSLNASYGYFLTDCWLLGFKLGFGGINSDINFSGGLFTEYNFLTGTKWVPFIGLGANWKHIDSDFYSSDAIEMAGEFGVKYFLRSNVAISLSMAGTWASDSLPNSDDFGSRINIGLRYFF